MSIIFFLFQDHPDCWNVLPSRIPNVWSINRESRIN